MSGKFVTKSDLLFFHAKDESHLGLIIMCEEPGWSLDAALVRHPKQISLGSLSYAGQCAKNYFATHSITGLKILEVFAGDCSASFTVCNAWRRYDRNVIKYWVATEILDYPGREDIINFHVMNAIHAVDKYGRDSDVLIMITAPNDCTDYYCLRKFIEQRQYGWFIFIGDPREHGTIGIWDYCATNMKMVLDQEVDSEGKNKILIFEIIQSQSTQEVP